MYTNNTLLLDFQSKKRYLKPNVTPSLHLPERSLDKKFAPSSPSKKGDRRTIRAGRRQTTTFEVEDFPLGDTDGTLSTNSNTFGETNTVSVDEMNAASALLYLADPAKIRETVRLGHKPKFFVHTASADECIVLFFLFCGRLMQDKYVQVSLDTMTNITISHFLTTDVHLNAWCGIQTFKGFDCLADTIDLILQETKYPVSFRLSTREMLCLCLIKLKTALPFSCIAPVFKISHVTCSNYFTIMIDILYVILKNFIRWPSKKEIRKTMPRCFGKYPDTRVILDCSETRIDKLGCIDCRVKTFSHYKGHETIKYLLGIDPSGEVTYISVTYGGRASDKFIFNDCGLADILEEGDGVMVDKGFDIDTELLRLGCKLIRPPFMRRKKRLNPEEAIENADIAQLRVHVEHAFSRVKAFRIFETQLCYNLLHLADKMIFVICGLVNLETPIMIKEVMYSHPI